MIIMGLWKFIENMQFTHFAYLLITAVALLTAGYLGTDRIIPVLGAVGEALYVLTVFHNMLITFGFIFLVLAGIALFIFIEVS